MRSKPVKLLKQLSEKKVKVAQKITSYVSTPQLLKVLEEKTK